MKRATVVLLLLIFMQSHSSAAGWDLYPPLGEGRSVNPQLEHQMTMDELLELGTQLRIVQNHEDAKSAFKKLIELGKSNNEEVFVAKAYVNLAWISEIQGNEDDAIQYHEMALNVSQNIDYKEGVALGYRNLGIAYDKNGKRELARSYFLRALNIYKELKQERDVKILTRMLSELQIN